MSRELILDAILREVIDLSEDKEIEDSMAPGKTEGWDSMANMTLISELEERMGIEFDFDELMQIEDWGAMKQIAMNKIQSDVTEAGE